MENLIILILKVYIFEGKRSKWEEKWSERSQVVVLSKAGEHLASGRTV